MPTGEPRDDVTGKRAGFAAPSDPLAIGWREFVALPEWGIRGIKAKVDTGARSSAIDVANLEILPGRRVRFDVIVSRNYPNRRTSVEATVVRTTHVRSSVGETQERLIVATTVRLGPVEHVVELGLVCRQNMLCRMLLGRSALAGRFVVDPGRRYVLSRRRRRSSPSVLTKRRPS